jgi:hypothetical protein
MIGSPDVVHQADEAGRHGDFAIEMVLEQLAAKRLYT